MKNLVAGTFALIMFGAGAAGASTIGVMFESVANEGPGDEVAFATYSDFPSLMAANQSSLGFSGLDVAGNFDTTGLTWDGSQFVLMFESVANEGPGDEVAFATYSDFPSLMAANQSSLGFSELDVAGNFDTTGLTWDGSQFVLMFESVANAGPGDEVAFATYANFTDLMAANQSSLGFSGLDVAGNFDTTGLTWDGSQFVLMFESVANAGPGDEVAFATYANFTDLMAANQSSLGFSGLDVAGNFDTTGLYSFDDPRGGDSSVVPLPSSAWLLWGALLAFGLAARRRRAALA